VEDRRFELLSPPCKGGAKPSQLIPQSIFYYTYAIKYTSAESVGFEPTVPFSTTVFKTVSINQTLTTLPFLY
jgi:hypothetical protein